MITKIKLIITAIGAFLIAVFAFLFQMERHKRKETQTELKAARADAMANIQKDEAQTAINAVMQNYSKSTQKHGKKPNKIMLPILFIFLIFGCARFEYSGVTHAPELFIFETGASLNLQEDTGLYCATYDEAEKIQKALQAYLDEITAYNLWRENNKKGGE